MALRAALVPLHWRPQIVFCSMVHLLKRMFNLLRSLLVNLFATSCLNLARELGQSLTRLLLGHDDCQATVRVGRKASQTNII